MNGSRLSQSANHSLVCKEDDVEAKPGAGVREDAWVDAAAVLLSTDSKWLNCDRADASAPDDTITLFPLAEENDVEVIPAPLILSVPGDDEDGGNGVLFLIEDNPDDDDNDVLNNPLAVWLFYYILCRRSRCFERA